MDYYISKYTILQKRRSEIWNEINSKTFKEKWFLQRPTEHQWSIDEILRHMLANEIRYLQMPIDENVKMDPIGLRAQWVGNILFRLEETEHQSLLSVQQAFKNVQRTSRKLIETLTKHQLKLEVKTPWGEMKTYQNMIDDLFEHENFHRGQVKFQITYFRGPPDFVEPPKDVDFG